MTQVLQTECQETEVCGSSYIAQGPHFAKKDVELFGVEGSLNQILLMLFCPCLPLWPRLRPALQHYSCRKQLSTPPLV